MGNNRKTLHFFLAGTAGLTILVGTSLLLASQPSETSQPLKIGAGNPLPASQLALARADHPAGGASIRTAHSAAFEGGAQTVAFASDLPGEPAPDYDDATIDPDAEAPTSYETFDLDGDSDVAADAAATDTDWYTHTLQKGERLTGLWEREWELPLATLYRLLDDDDNASILNRVRPGQEIEWQVDDEGYLTRLRLWTDRASGHEWVREADGWEFELGEVENGREVSHLIITAEIDGNIANALTERADISARSANALAVLLDRYLPVRTHARTGDQFTLLVEQETLVGDDTPLNLRLLAFDYEGERIEIRAARNVNGRFYTPDGESLLPPFDRRPFSGNYRISSSFNPNRRHPVTGRVAPHQGTDFAMPIGTPIQAPADGRVTRVENHPYAGRFIVIEHGQGYSTRYLHLDRPLVRPGQTVERGDRIALSGNTGRSTGPHLHYEIHVNSRPQNPMRVELPESDALEGDELDRFKSISQTLLAQLDNGQRNQQVAFTPFEELAR
ncbi:MULTISPECIES: peptidoglycan DD-metalloendopeptidase family protein [Thioalkalivibrio]|uniref:peptidoglycan DD-metalloendopeptidase family protein n=1 Tax=Thioalkalivibrio TaxID=106633 RepID=UPI0005BAC1A4|nr:MULTISPECIES: peptidoglycan DD-metalloendopeptidase family protein [Thioalkalivibrio]OOC48420.1 peptidase M23 [Thioalkalivibrio versutus]